MFTLVAESRVSLNGRTSFLIKLSFDRAAWIASSTLSCIFSICCISRTESCARKMMNNNQTLWQPNQVKMGEYSIIAGGLLRGRHQMSYRLRDDDRKNCTPLQWESDSLRRKAGSQVEQRTPLAVVRLWHQSWLASWLHSSGGVRGCQLPSLGTSLLYFPQMNSSQCDFSTYSTSVISLKGLNKHHIIFLLRFRSLFLITLCYCYWWLLYKSFKAFLSLPTESPNPHFSWWIPTFP